MRNISGYVFGILDKLNAWIWRLGFNDNHPHGLILMYHNISDEFIDIDSSCKCKIDEFKQSLLHLIDDGYTFVSMETVYSFLKEIPNFKFASVTFDDVPENVLQNAIPILNKYQIPFTLFIATQYAKTAGYINEAQLKELSKNPLCTIGAHTVSHPMLRKSRNSFKEMKESKKYLENLSGKEVKFLAYPFGKHSSVSLNVRRQAKRIGFKCAFGTIGVPITRQSSKCMFYLPRIVYEL